MQARPEAEGDAASYYPSLTPPFGPKKKRQSNILVLGLFWTSPSRTAVSNKTPGIFESRYMVQCSDCGVSALPGAHALPVPVSFLPPCGEQARRAGRCVSPASVHAAHATNNGQTTRTVARGEGHEAVRGFASAWCPGVHRAWHTGMATRRARLCEPVVPGRPSRVARPNGVAARGAHGKRGARAQGQRRKPQHT